MLRPEKVSTASLVVRIYHQIRFGIPGAVWLIMTAFVANAATWLVVRHRSIKIETI
jgi:hypothetical protein